MAERAAFFRDSRGAAAAEMALILPLLIVMLFVTFEGAYYLWNQHKVVKGVRDGARYAGRLDFTNYDCSSDTIVAATVTKIKNVTRTGFPTGDNPTKAGADNPMVAGWTNTDPGVSVTMDCATGQKGLYDAISGNAPLVTVSATVPYPESPLSDLVALLGFDTSGISLKASSQSAVMGL